MADALPPLIRTLLAAPACYEHAVEKLELIETHISWVLLTGLYAYKIKKPVNPGFLDFSTLERRRQDCLEELRLNRRLAADIYLDVVAITGTTDAPRVNGAGEALEYAVKLRQFPADATLDRLAARGELGNLQIDALAVRLAHFHLFECEHAASDSPWGEPDAVAQPVTENFRILAARLDNPAEMQRLADLQDWCNAEHARLVPLMSARKQLGFVRECHGDLHLANLAWFDGQLLIFDCLEFNPALRWIDVISEVAFCYMDLLQKNYQSPLHIEVEGDDCPLSRLRERVEVRAGGYAGLAFRFLNAWLEVTGDYEGVALLRYYAVYRALVRAKVAALRAEQGCNTSRAEVTSCLQLAAQLSQSAPLQLWITHGLSGSGKTTHSQHMLEKHGMIRLRSDVERKRLAGLDARARGGEASGLYSTSFGLRTYQYLAERAEDLLASGWSVVVDAAFLQRRERDRFRDLARRTGADFRILDMPADPAVLRERVRQRQAEGNDASDADLRVLEQQLATARPLDADELDEVMQAGLTGQV
ncbi:MAG: AAA family ATPase [Gallionella sp.]|nr:AAA family ATPase [Gallionella sp.]